MNGSRSYARARDIAAGVNPLLDDKTIEFLLYDVLDAEGLLALPAFAEHSRETFDMVIGNAR